MHDHARPDGAGESRYRPLNEAVAPYASSSSSSAVDIVRAEKSPEARRLPEMKPVRPRRAVPLVRCCDCAELRCGAGAPSAVITSAISTSCSPRRRRSAARIRGNSVHAATAAAMSVTTRRRMAIDGRPSAADCSALLSALAPSPLDSARHGLRVAMSSPDADRSISAPAAVCVVSSKGPETRPSERINHFLSVIAVIG